MSKCLGTALAGVCMAVAVTAAHPAAAGGRVLTAGQMDRVTAGAAIIDFGSAASVTGNFGFTSAAGGGAITGTSLPGGGLVQSGAGGAVSSGFTSGGNVSTAASSGGGVGGTPLLHLTINGTLGTGNAQASTSFTFVSGGTVFLP